MKILKRIHRTLKRFNERFIAGTTGGTARDISMIEGSERKQFEADEDENRK